MHEIYCIVSGKVQNVAYRAYVQDTATALELVGYVSNRRDGTVEVVAQGESDVLKSLIEHLYEGSLAAKVEGVAVEWRTAKRNFDEFSIKH